MKLQFILSLSLFLLVGIPNQTEAQVKNGGEQKEIYDPLKKPHLWRKLVDTPDNQSLWAEYMGKDWKDMTEEDKRYISRWRKAIVENNAPKVDYESFVSTKFNSMEELLTWERMMMEESHRVTELKTNIAANFLLIEDTFVDLFEELDRGYRRYDQVHKDGKYNQIKWVEDHENRINYIKEQVVEAYKRKYKMK